MTPDEALAIVTSKAAGRTRHEGQEPNLDEVLAMEVFRLRSALLINGMRWGISDDQIDRVLYPSKAEEQKP